MRSERRISDPLRVDAVIDQIVERDLEVVGDALEHLDPGAGSGFALVEDGAFRKLERVQ